MNNNDRAETVEGAIQDFVNLVGLDPRPESDGPVTAAGDMISNILHWAALRAGTEGALTAVRNGISHFVIEHAAHGMEDADGEAFVDITVTGLFANLKGELENLAVDMTGQNTRLVGFEAARAAFVVLK